MFERSLDKTPDVKDVKGDRAYRMKNGAKAVLRWGPCHKRHPTPIRGDRNGAMPRLAKTQRLIGVELRE